MANVIQNNINEISKNTYSEISERGIDVIKEMFSTGTTLREKLEITPEKEYLKKMLISQMDIDEMLLTHKYYNKGFEGISEFREESDKIKGIIQDDSVLNFDEDTIQALFGNSLNIISDKECERWKQLIYNGQYAGYNINDLYTEEKFKIDYENEKNKIKKFIQSFKYKKLFRQDAIENLHIKQVRKVVKENIISNPDASAGYIITESRNQIEQGVSEYVGLQELESIAKITLTSLQQSNGEQINIEEECEKIRSMMNEDNPAKFDTNYRQKQVTIGTDRGISTGPVIETIPFEKIPEVMKDLQQRYENAYNTSENEEDYIKEIAKIYADFVYIQPYEDGNKRTATCLLNTMLLSKGIIPPPISLSNGGEELGEAFSKAHNKDYTMLQDIMNDKYNKTKLTAGENDVLGASQLNKKMEENDR